jgi:hypothetical protein
VLRQTEEETEDPLAGLLFYNEKPYQGHHLKELMMCQMLEYHKSTSATSGGNPYTIAPKI